MCARAYNQRLESSQSYLEICICYLFTLDWHMILKPSGVKSGFAAGCGNSILQCECMDSTGVIVIVVLKIVVVLF